MNSYDFTDLDNAIKKLQELKKKNDKCMVIICTIDFDNDTEIQKAATPEEGCFLARESKTIIINEDNYLPHIQLYSTVQNDIENIIREGIMHDIIFPAYDRTWIKNKCSI